MGTQADRPDTPKQASTPQPPTYLFTLRVWQVETEDLQTAWRGRLQQVPGGECRYFQGWPALVAGLSELLPAPDNDSETA